VENFVSTETMMTISLLCKRMPNLLKYIIQYSKPTTKKDVPALPVTVLSPQQIQEARSYPNTIIKEVLATAAIIQHVLNSANNKRKKIIEQRHILEEALIALLSIREKEEAGQ